MTHLTLLEVQQAMPPALKGSVGQSLVDQLNNIQADPEFAEIVRDKFISYTKVLSEGKFKIQSYLDAVMYVSYKIMGYSNLEAYCKTFPQRFADLQARGTSSKDIGAYVSGYHRGKLVNLIMENTLVPIWVLNQEVYQKAINTQADLMVNAQSELVRTQAANSILTHLAKPKEAAGVAINVNMGNPDGLNELRDTLTKLAGLQQLAVQGGTPIKTVAGMDIIEVQATNVS